MAANKKPALPPADTPGESQEYQEFSGLWTRANELRDILSKLPSHIVMKSGMAGQRARILEHWDTLETPGIDGSVPDGAVEGLRKWIHTAEVLVGFIVQIGRGAYSGPEKGRVYSDPNEEEDPQDAYEVIDSLDEAMGIDDWWCWPWTGKKLVKVKGFDKGKLIKIGAVAGLGVLALMTYLDEED